MQEHQAKEQLHALIDQLSDAHADAVLAFAQVLQMDPVSRAMQFAPYDDEPISDEEQIEVERALKDPRPRVPLDQVKDLFGL